MEITVDYDPALCLFHSKSRGLEFPTEEVNAHYIFNDNVTEYSRLLEEIEFLCRFLTDQKTLVVHGSYPNRHYDILAMMFPQLSIELWDTNNYPSNKVRVNEDTLNETQAHDLYFGKNVLFICYLELTPDLVQFEKMKSYQAQLVRAIQPAQCSLTFTLPDLGNNEHDYFRGFITPSVLTPPEVTLRDKLCRCIPILDSGKYVICAYSTEWYYSVCNYWNSIAKKGKVLKNSINGATSINNKGKLLLCGIEVCRTLDILQTYLKWAGEEYTLNKVLKVVSYLDEQLGYSLVDHSSRYLSTGTETEVEYVKLSVPPSLDQAHEMLFFEDIGSLRL